MTPEAGNRGPSGIDASLSGNWPTSPATSVRVLNVAVERELRSHEYQREVAVGDRRTSISQRVWEIRVDSKLDRAAKRVSSADSHEEVPRRAASPNQIG
jgi:hypothetical protein